jgi:hypothetical protein
LDKEWGHPETETRGRGRQDRILDKTKRRTETAKQSSGSIWNFSGATIKVLRPASTARDKDTSEKQREEEVAYKLQRKREREREYGGVN